MEELESNPVDMIDEKDLIQISQAVSSARYAGPKSLYAKMSRIMGKMSRMEKKGYNDYFKYAYVTNEDVADAVRAAMAEEGLAFFPSIREIKTVTYKANTNKGLKDVIKTLVYFDFTFADGETGETLTTQWVGEAIDETDKAIAKAATSAQKYFLLKTFIIGTGDDPDSDKDGGNGQSSSSGARRSASGNGRSLGAPQNGGKDNRRAAKPAPQAEETEGPPWYPKAANDYSTYYSATIPFFKTTREVGVRVLGENNKDAQAAARALLELQEKNSPPSEKKEDSPSESE